MQGHHLARVQAEAAGGQLHNPNRRISEIAYDVGFQSLTQFNRTFRRIYGQSPSQFRTQLHPKARGSKPRRRKKVSTKSRPAFRNKRPAASRARFIFP